MKLIRALRAYTGIIIFFIGLLGFQSIINIGNLFSGLLMVLGILIGLSTIKKTCPIINFMKEEPGELEFKT